MKQVLMLRYQSTKCSKHYEHINGKKRSQFTYSFLDPNFPKSKRTCERTFLNCFWQPRSFSYFTKQALAKTKHREK